MNEPTLTEAIYRLLEDLQQRTGKSIREIEAEARELERGIREEQRAPTLN